MKRYNFVYALLLSCLLAACGKESTPPSGTASLNIVNAVVGSSQLAPNFSGSASYDFYRVLLAEYGHYIANSSHYSSFRGEQPLWIYNYPDTTSKDQPLLKLQLHMPVGSMQTLFVTGTLAKPDSLLTQDQLPYHALSDSTTGIRFVNLSPGSQPIKVVMRGKSSPEVASMAYKTASGFIAYPFKSGNKNFVFEFRDAASDALIATYTVSDVPDPIDPVNWPNQNVTLALIGAPGQSGAWAQKVMPIQY
ncbi:DUF4397 domain-containing protein [Chitinophaga vietnamensis]|uniref:DUF4397 domain-containing protein n=1 Tax=Chitinophaga vietnamensis TaxID=2593957 RepID=UPI001177328C|nr:DUF4397 domain-containing protein [Chitinophaga vietnamensis]